MFFVFLLLCSSFLCCSLLGRGFLFLLCRSDILVLSQFCLQTLYLLILGLYLLTLIGNGGEHVLEFLIVDAAIERAHT